MTARCLTNQNHVRLIFDQHGNPLSQERMIVDTKNTYGHCFVPLPAVGTDNSTSVPDPTRLRTLRRALILSALSRIPESPQCPSRPDSSTSKSIPQPSSLINRRN